MLNKDKIVRFDVKSDEGYLIISTDTFDFPRDFFKVKNTEFVVLKGKDIGDARKGQKVEVIVYYKNGDRHQYKTNLDLATEMQVNLHLGPDYILMEERRGSFKTATDVQAFVSKIVREEEEPVIFDEPLAIKIKNINVGGVFMESEYPFDENDVLSLIMIDGKLKVAAEVLRIQTNDSGKVVGYGCKFLSLSLSEEAVVARFIFDCQLAERERLKKYSR